MRADIQIIATSGTSAFLAFLLLGAAGCGHGKTETPSSAEIPAVAVVTPTWQPLKRTILQPGYAKPYEQTPIYSRVAGYVDSVPVDIGDQVKEGQLLALVRVPELAKELNAKVARWPGRGAGPAEPRRF